MCLVKSLTNHDVNKEKAVKARVFLSLDLFSDTISSPSEDSRVSTLHKKTELKAGRVLMTELLSDQQKKSLQFCLNHSAAGPKSSILPVGRAVNGVTDNKNCLKCRCQKYARGRSKNYVTL